MPKFQNYALLMLLLNFSFYSCAYFNTFYNAQEYFEKAEQQRLEKAGETVPAAAIDAYNKVIEKSQFVIDKYPDSKFVEDALLLMGKSRYYRKEYRIAESVFNQYSEGYKKYAYEAEYWQALCKWKLGKPQPALDALNSLLASVKDPAINSSVHLSIAEIYLESDNHDSAMAHFTIAAETNTNHDERGQIYYRIADLAFKKENYQQALKANEEVLKNTNSKIRKEEANLQIVRIQRLLGDWDKVKNLIRSMLLDDTYKTIHGDLELELAKLYQMDHQFDEAINRLEDIKESYKNTKTSAEAYFIHGDIALFEQWNLEEAKKHFSQVAKEFRKSDYTSTANLRVNEITNYQNSLKLKKSLEESIAANIQQIDSLQNDSLKNGLQSVLEKSRKDLVVQLYNLGELEAFHFKREDSSVTYFQQIIEDFSDSEFYLKSIFALYFLYNKNNQTYQAEHYSNIIIENFPVSEYADYIRKKLDLPETPGSTHSLLLAAEAEWLINHSNALPIYKSILSKDQSSETAARAALFLAYHYDHTFSEQDSAYFYYSWLQENHIDSEQAQSCKTRFELLKQNYTMVETDSAGH